MPYKARVTGRFRGTTDEIIQWAAAKHGIDTNVMRAVAVIESWWRMSTVGDNGDSFGLYQIRRPFHCCPAYARRSTAFNADYYGAIIRAYYDGKMPWLNTVERGAHVPRRRPVRQPRRVVRRPLAHAAGQRLHHPRAPDAAGPHLAQQRLLAAAQERGAERAQLAAREPARDRRVLFHVRASRPPRPAPRRRRCRC